MNMSTLKNRSLIYIVLLLTTINFSLELKSQTFEVRGGIIHIGDGTIIENGIISVENGEIKYVGERDKVTLSSDKKIVNANGKHIYPGLIAVNSTLGLTEVDAVRATRDYAETGGFNPNVRSLIAYNTDSKIIPTVRSNGVLVVQSAPTSGVISGTSSILHTAGWNWEDAVLKADDGIYINWPQQYRQSGWWASGQSNKKVDGYTEKVNSLLDFLAASKAYCAGNKKINNSKYNALCSLYNAKQKVFVRVNAPNQIVDAVIQLKEIDIDDIVIVGGRESHHIVDFLVDEKIPVILKSSHSLPRQAHYDIDLPYKKAKILNDAGVLVALSMDGSWEQRNLAFVAGQTVSYGLNKEEALQLITNNTAKILGIEEQVGSIEKGKQATFLICEGDLLDMRTSIIEKAFIKGEEVDLNNKQLELYNKFSSKYKNERKF